jgi:hypothetical protein
MKTEEVEKIAQGRVWIGTDAKSINAKEIIDFFIFILVLVCISFAKISIFSLTQRYIFIIFRCFCTILFVICYFFTIFAEK